MLFLFLFYVQSLPWPAITGATVAIVTNHPSIACLPACSHFAHPLICLLHIIFPNTFSCYCFRISSWIFLHSKHTLRFEWKKRKINRKHIFFLLQTKKKKRRGENYAVLKWESKSMKFVWKSFSKLTNQNKRKRKKKKQNRMLFR